MNNFITIATLTHPNSNKILTNFSSFMTDFEYKVIIFFSSDIVLAQLFFRSERQSKKALQFIGIRQFSGFLSRRNLIVVCFVVLSHRQARLTYKYQKKMSWSETSRNNLGWYAVRQSNVDLWYSKGQEKIANDRKI